MKIYRYVYFKSNSPNPDEMGITNGELGIVLSLPNLRFVGKCLNVLFKIEKPDSQRHVNINENNLWTTLSARSLGSK
ncbi:hypothetical protein K0M31_008659 [Melipona bicolor]|uniref:Uncharacterized protein n=1 Tax=Melipona bicolor TaxID=60889 RepID=A0AA40FPP0_9HYME|nr:hypothetical protein K0M31_008659 [Melipona bicolor]